MLIGIMTRALSRPSLDAVADAICRYQLGGAQLNLSSAGLDPLPEALDEERAVGIGDVFRSRGIAVAAVSANFNAIHPNREVRAEGIRRAGLVASRCRALGSPMITMCTGTRDPANMWRYHAANSEPSAWDDLLETTRQLTAFAEEYGVTIAFEPEVVNVVDSAEKAERFLEESGSGRLGVLLDPANLITPDTLRDTRKVLEDAFARLRGRIVMAHAKDVVDPEPGERECRRVTAGTGLLDYQRYMELLAESGFDGALVMHDLAESEITGCRRMLESLFQRKPHNALLS